MEKKINKLFNKTMLELKNLCFNKTNLIDDLSSDETEHEKEIVEREIINVLSGKYKDKRTKIK